MDNSSDSSQERFVQIHLVQLLPNFLMGPLVGWTRLLFFGTIRLAPLFQM